MPSSCKLCAQHGIIVREDNVHLAIFCPRAYNLAFYVTPTLERIAETNHISLSDLILGKQLHDQKRQTLFNFVVQHYQLAIWQSRINLNMERGEIEADSIFRKNVFRNLCRVRIAMGIEKFREFFDEIIRVSPNPIGFSLRL